MQNYTDNHRLKNSVEIGGKQYEIRSDFSVILDIMEAMEDPELNGQQCAYVILNIFYPEFDSIPSEHYQEAIDRCMDFIGCGMPKKSGKSPRIVSWSQDFSLIIGAINRILGYDIRSIPYDAETNTGGVSWETFMSAYMEIGDCLFAQIVSIRDKLARGKKLEKHEREWYRQNKELVDFKTKYTQAEEEFLRKWI